MKHIKKLLGKESADQKEIEKDSLFSSCVLIGNDIYSFTNSKKLPIKWNLKTREMILLEDLKNYDAQFTVDYMLRVENSVYALELNGKRVLYYDLDEKRCQYYEIGCHKEAWGNYAAFAHWKGILFIFPKYKDEIVKIKIESGKIEKINNLYRKSGIDELKINPQDDKIFFWYGFQDKNIVWLFLKRSNIVLSYDMKLDTWKKHKLSVKINSCVHAIKYNGYIYVLSSEGKIFCWNVTNNIIKNIADCSEGIIEDNIFSRIAVTDKNIFLFPAVGKKIFCIDLSDEWVKEYTTYPSEFSYYGPDGWSKYYGYCEDEDFYYFAMRTTNFIACINKKIGCIEWVRISLPEIKKWTGCYIKYHYKLINEKECSIENMLDYLSVVYGRKEDYVSIGSRIFGQM